MSGLSLKALSRSHVDELSSSWDEPAWLKEYRRASLSAYATMPVETSPLYNKYTDAGRMDPSQVSLSAGEEPSIPDRIRTRLSEIQNETHIVQIGTAIHAVRVSDEARGIVISSIRDAIRDRPDTVRAALDASDSAEDKYTALNNAAFDSGVFIYVPDGTILERPVHILSSLAEDQTSVISRNLIHVGDGSKASVVHEVYSVGSPVQQAYMELLNVSVGEGSHLDVTTLQMMDKTSVNFSTRRTDVARDGRINWYLGLFGAMLSRYRTDYHLNGTGAAVNDSEVAFGSGNQSFDIQTHVNHHAASTEGRVTEKSILRDTSRSLFKGMIRIMEGASKSNSYLSGRSILLDKDAKSDAIPGLEILTNDVKATHSASVAQIDEEQIFYLQSRCLGKREAERTIVEGFLEPLSRKMSYQVRAWIAYLVESKWEGRELSINTDEELRKFVEVEETRYNENSEIEQHYKYR